MALTGSMFDLEVDLSFAELQESWTGAESRAEHARLVRVPDQPAEIRAFLGAHGEMAPQALAALELRSSS